ncbi:FAD binding domain protein [Colletotrichum kahawae]|uniref:FAD binding domain protein n=1 Tax=Colletotrichum kahawae TaxID=34407 RepID=A0AAD9YT05_COLKA|nr:FAD binding domain protein [Colletotrichum kahawae]
MSDKPFTVLIAGGGIAGLTLANMLEKIGVNYLILEGYREMAPQVGASIGILPNGCRVLDQIGLYDEIRKLIDGPLYETALRLSEGHLVTNYLNVGGQVRERHGYDTVFVDRQMILEVLWRNLKHKDNILVSKKVTKVELEPSRVKVETGDGSSYYGDILIGADGVHSKVRNEMWRLADALEPGYIPASEYKGKSSLAKALGKRLIDGTECLPTVYKCIFGISIDKSWEPQTVQTNLNKGFSYLVISGPKDRVYWFLFVNMGKTHYGPELPSFTKEDEETLANEHMNDKILENRTFRDLYSTKISSVLTPLPEYVFKKWHFQRIMTIGDAAHKFEPIAGQGGNSAIETAAVLVSNLATMLQSKTRPSDITSADINAVFTKTQATRELRTQTLVKASHEEQRFADMETPLLEVVGKHVAPVLSLDEKWDQWSQNIEGGHKLEILDNPKRPHAVPFHDELASTPLAPSYVPKITVAAALCGLLYIAQQSLVLNTGPEVVAVSASFVGVPAKTTYTGFPSIDNILAIFVWAFSEQVAGPDPNSRTQCLYFLINLIPIIYIWTVEGYRNGNVHSLVSIPSIFGIYQLLGIGKVAPFYFLLSVYTTSRSVYARTTGRPIPSHVAKVILPALCLGYVIPTALMFIPHEDSVTQQNAIAFWQPFPIYVALLAWTGSKVVYAMKPTKTLDWEVLENKDLSYLQSGYAFCFFVTAITHISTFLYAGLNASVSISESFFGLPPWDAMTIAGFWKYDMVLCFASVAVWLLYGVFEMRRFGYITTSAALKAVGLTLAGSVLVGPAATYAGVWAWRESVIASYGKAVTKSKED